MTHTNTYSKYVAKNQFSVVQNGRQKELCLISLSLYLSLSLLPGPRTLSHYFHLFVWLGFRPPSKWLSSFKGIVLGVQERQQQQIKRCFVFRAHNGKPWTLHVQFSMESAKVYAYITCMYQEYTHIQFVVTASMYGC